MQTRLILVDTETGGAQPVKCELSTEMIGKDIFTVTVEELKMELWIYLSDVVKLLSEVSDSGSK